jgi:N-acetylmuramoyl-L-alanine amidase
MTQQSDNIYSEGYFLNYREVVRIKICIDPGHGGKSPGAAGDYSVEKDLNLELSLKLEAVLKEMGIEIVMTRKEDSYLSLQERCSIANGSGCDYFLSIHCNGYKDSNASGTGTYYYEGSGEGRAFASAIQSAAAGYNGNMDRGVRTADFYVLRKTVMPAVLLETAFITNKYEEDMLNNREWQDGFTKNLGRAVGKYFAMEFPGSNSRNIIYRVFHNEVQKGAFKVKGNAVDMLDNILSSIDEGNVKITVSAGE